MFQIGTMSTMSIQDLATLIGLASIFISGATFVIGIVSRVFWKLTFQRKVEDDIVKFKKIEEKITQIDSRTMQDQKDNEAFRHKYKTSVENLYELIKLRFDDWDKNLDSFKRAVEDKIDLAILKNEKRNEKRK